MPSLEGPLLLADISGYTRFITATELEHSQDIVTELLDTLVTSLSERLTMAQLEGDAVFFVGERTSPELVEWSDEAFVAFHRRLRDINALTTCPCQACVLAPALSLKVIAHHGVYSRQRIGGTTQVHGPDVIVPHRLAKNHVPSHEYLLVTRSLLDRLDGRAAEFTLHEEDVPDFGRLAVAYRDLGALRERAYAHERQRVEREEARVTSAETFRATPQALWKVLTDANDRQLWMGVPRLDFRPGARGSLLGGEYHCHHGNGEVVSFRVVALDEPRYLTLYSRFLGREVYMTHEIEKVDAEHYRLEMRATWEMPGGKTDTDVMAATILEDMAASAVPAIRGLVAEAAAR